MRLSRITTLVSVVVYATALTQKGFHSVGEPPGAWSPGLYFLFVGPLSVLYGVFEWLGNPVLFAAWIFPLARKNKIALPLALLATALIAAFLFRQTIVASEAPTYAKITGYAAGYWLWLSSAVLAILASVIGLINKMPRYTV